MAAEPQVTPASQWRTQTKEGFVTELPSGNFARIRRTMDLFDLLKNGQIPNPLAARIKDMLNSKGGGLPDLSQGEGDQGEAVTQMMDLVARQCVATFVEPRVEVKPDDWDPEAIDPDTKEKKGEWEPSEGAISIDDLTIQDRMFVFAFAQGMALDLSAFRGQPAAPVAPVTHGEGVAADPGVSAVPDGPVPGVLPERGDVAVRESGGTPAARSGGGPRKASGQGSRKAKGAKGGAARAKQGQGR